MQVLKHKKSSEYIFIFKEGEYSTCYIINKKTNYVGSTIFEQDTSTERKFFKKHLKKGFEWMEIDSEILAKTQELIENFELDKTHYFIGELKENKLETNLATLSLTEKTDGFILRHIDPYEAFSTVSDYLRGHMPSTGEKFAYEGIKDGLSFFINMYSLLGLELVDTETLLTKISGCNITNSSYDTEMIEYKMEPDYPYGEIFIKANYFRDERYIRLDTYEVKDGKILDIQTNYNVYETPDSYDKNVKLVKKEFQDSNKYEKPISHQTFFERYSLELKEPKLFRLPEKVTVELDPIPLQLAQNILPVKEMNAPLVEQNKLYFYANTSEKNPLEWDVAFVAFTNFEDKVIVASDIFKLKDFNAVMKAMKVETYNSTDREKLIKKKAKLFRTEKLKSIETSKIFEILSGKSSDELLKQEIKEIIIWDNEGESQIVALYDNYAQVGYYDSYFVQFFKDSNARKAWIKDHKKGEQKVYQTKVDILNQYIQKIQAYDNQFDEKLKIASDPLLKKEKSTIEYLRDMHFKIHHEDINIKGDYLPTESVIIYGDLNIEGTLYFKKMEGFSTDKPFFIVKGNVTCQNLIIEYSSYRLMLVEGDLTVANVAVNAHKVLCGGTYHVNTLLHYAKSPMDITDKISYTYEVSIRSNQFVDKSIVSKPYGMLDFATERIYGLLKENKAFLPTNLESKTIGIDELYAHKFENKMKDWGYYYHDFAGCERLSIGYDNEIKGNCVYPEGGDWVVHDIRGKSGTYGVSHEDSSICALKVKNPEEHGVNYRLKPLKLTVNAETLMKRYQWIAMLFVNSPYDKTVSPFGVWKDFKALNKDYENEKIEFVSDPYLALYWLIHFGFTCDNRYEEVKKIALDNNLGEKLEYIIWAISFFNKHDAFYNLEIGKEKKYKNLFLMRRAYLVFITHAYQYASGENSLDKWWLSIQIYPKMDRNMIFRMNWLKNNLYKFDKWTEFDSLFKKEKNKKIPLISYVFATNPNTKDQAKHANILIQELLDNREAWKGKAERNFAQTMIWDVRDFISDKKKLKQAMDFYFKGDTSSEKFEDLMKVIG